MKKVATRSVKKICIAGGGTGGHIWAGVAIAEEWKKIQNAEAFFVGAKGGLEEKLVPTAGIKLELLKMGSLNRVSFLTKLRTLFLLPMAFFKSIWILWRERPSVVIGVGGYAAGPVVLMACLSTVFGAKCKTAIIEQNTVLGLTNRILAKFVQVIFCAFPLKQSKGAKPTINPIITGNPIRSRFKRLSTASRDPFVIFCFGGSQGAKGMNSVILNALPFLAPVKDKIKFIHQTGEADFERVLEGHRSQGFSTPRVEKFIFEMEECYRAASLVIARSGSSTLSELACVGRASILVPLPTAADNHQYENARQFELAGASFVIDQNDKGASEKMAMRIIDLVNHSEQIELQEQAVSNLYLEGAAGRIVMELSKVALN